MKKIVYITIVGLLITISSFGQKIKSVNDAKGISVGIEAPLFVANDAHNNEFSLAEALKKGPVVVIFYRGNWCPVCTKHLGKIQDSLDLITKTGATIVAVTPEKPTNMERMEEKTGAKFSLLFDEGYKISNAFDVTFDPTKGEKRKYNTFLGANLDEANSNNSEQLPIPATYVINQKGIITWRHFDPNYKNRASVKDIIVALAHSRH